MSCERILIADEDRITTKKIEHQLTEMGFVVVCIAENGPEAIEKTRAHSPDLLLMDVNLGGVPGGIETARTIMQKYRVPVIYLSAREDEDTLSQALATNPLGYINKPLREQDLRTTISLAMSRLNTGYGAVADRAESNSSLWQVKFTCDSEGKVIRVHHGSKKTLQIIGIGTHHELFPDSHTEHIKRAIANKNPQLVFGKRQAELLCCEYQPLSNNIVNLTISCQAAGKNPGPPERSDLLNILDHLSAGVILFNENLKIAYCNKAAQKILGSGDCLSNYDGLLTCRDPEITARLIAMVRDREDHLISLARGDHKPPLNTLVTPLKTPYGNAGTCNPTAILFAFETTDNQERVEEVIRSLYRLSPTEARLVAQLFITPHLATAAEVLGITLNTARTHLKRIYNKTHVNRISSLVHLIVTGPASVILNTNN